MNREELEEQLRPLVFSCPGSAIDTCPFSGCTSCDENMAKVMDLIDQYVRKRPKRRELWTAEKVADYLGLADHNGARTTMSRADIAGVNGRHPDTGRRTSLYPAEQVRRLKRRRSSK